MGFGSQTPHNVPVLGSCLFFSSPAGFLGARLGALPSPTPSHLTRLAGFWLKPLQLWNKEPLCDSSFPDRWPCSPKGQWRGEQEQLAGGLLMPHILNSLSPSDISLVLRHLQRKARVSQGSSSPVVHASGL
ncbi:hypothetical protein KIL84_008829 [Mauremys mutica]|uniref:Uncharacterized protein n=1 Tax=Mauremys mutica TaxID=74926 RepID=A0A9D4AY44_9SAUR|nr:hypothetical protein KIL84_008829 [Mauremys mutica]